MKACVEAGLALSLISGSARAALIPAEKNHVISLDGTWRFKIEQMLPTRYTKEHPYGRLVAIDYPKQIEPFYTVDYAEGSDWKDIQVPGNWEIPGFSPATYDQPDNTSGLYRLWFHVPASWSGRLVKLNFDGVQNGCEVWCNGHPVRVDEPSWGRENYHEGGWTAFQADLTPVIKFGGNNLLALRVTKNTRSVDCDTGDYFFLGGVHRPVTLFTVATSHVEDLTIQTRLLPGNEAEVEVIATVYGHRAGQKLSASIQGAHSAVSEIGEDGRVQLSTMLTRPRLWSAEFPNLYSLEVKLITADGETIEEIHRRIGIREVAVKDGVLTLNNVPIKLAGICRHDVFPDKGTAVDEAVWRKDLMLLKEANFNAVRTSHYPYGSGFYDLCDEMGFYVLDELPYCWVNCNDPSLTPAFEQRCRETVRRDKNHPCVLFWGIGNENRFGQNIAHVGDMLHELDPSRLRSPSCLPGDEAHADFDDAHYVTPQRIRGFQDDAERRRKYPQILTENPNVWDVRGGADYGCLDRWVEVFKRTWDVTWDASHVAGNFLWEWQDRAVADANPTKLYDFDPATGMNFVKIKGLVDGWRTPRADYYHCKMVLAPIRLGEKVKIDGAGATLEADNRYSFTDLSQVVTRWILLKRDREVAAGHARVKLAPRSSGTITLPLPAGACRSADTLRVAFENPGGWNIATYEFALKPREHAPPQVHLGPPMMFPRFNLVTFHNVPNNHGWHTTVRNHARLANIRVNSERVMGEADLSATPLQEVKSLDADIVLGDSASPGTSGSVHAEVANGEFSYQVNWSGQEASIQELGWIFRLPRACDHFAWDRQATWSYYPPTHIGRPRGTATPDSANQHSSRLTRPDAFDFTSTKYDCNWAVLADSAGKNGVCVCFEPTDRNHCKAADGGHFYELVVNKQCSPPEDISSNVVPDLYLKIAPKMSIGGRFTIHR